MIGKNNDRDRRKRLECCKLTLEVLENNDIGKNLYQSIGFVNYELDPAMGKAIFLEKKIEGNQEMRRKK